MFVKFSNAEVIDHRSASDLVADGRWMEDAFTATRDYGDGYIGSISCEYGPSRDEDTFYWKLVKDNRIFEQGFDYVLEDAELSCDEAYEWNTGKVASRSAFQERVGTRVKRAESASSGKKCGSFTYTPNTDGKYLYVAVRACTADVPNLNFDMLPHDELKTAYKTFIGSSVFMNHDNQDPEKARGVIIDAAYHTEDEGDKWIEVLMEMDEERAPKLCSLIRSGEIDTVSMGANVESTTCSVCGNVAEYPYQFCTHVQQKGREFDGKLAYEICNGIEFFEESWVYDPADPTAYTREVAAKKAKKVAYDYGSYDETSVWSISEGGEYDGEYNLEELMEMYESEVDKSEYPEFSDWEWDATRSGYLRRIASMTAASKRAFAHHDDVGSLIRPRDLMVAKRAQANGWESVDSGTWECVYGEDFVGEIEMVGVGVFHWSLYQPSTHFVYNEGDVLDLDDAKDWCNAEYEENVRLFGKESSARTSSAGRVPDGTYLSSCAARRTSFANESEIDSFVDENIGEFFDRVGSGEDAFAVSMSIATRAIGQIGAERRQVEDIRKGLIRSLDMPLVAGCEYALSDLEELMDGLYYAPVRDMDTLGAVHDFYLFEDMMDGWGWEIKDSAGNVLDYSEHYSGTAQDALTAFGNYCSTTGSWSLKQDDLMEAGGTAFACVKRSGIVEDFDSLQWVETRDINGHMFSSEMVGRDGEYVNGGWSPYPSETLEMEFVDNVEGAIMHYIDNVLPSRAAKWASWTFIDEYGEPQTCYEYDELGWSAQQFAYEDWSESMWQLTYDIIDEDLDSAKKFFGSINGDMHDWSIDGVGGPSFVDVDVDSGFGADIEYSGWNLADQIPEGEDDGLWVSIGLLEHWRKVFRPGIVDKAHEIDSLENGHETEDDEIQEELRGELYDMYQEALSELASLAAHDIEADRVYLLSEENFKEECSANEWLFSEDGELLDVPFGAVEQPSLFAKRAGMGDDVRSWYMSTYPTDDLGADIRDGMTFSNVAVQLANHGSDGFYEFIGAHDSLVRERIFEKISDELGVDYDTVYDEWLHNDGHLADALLKHSAGRGAKRAQVAPAPGYEWEYGTVDYVGGQQGWKRNFSTEDKEILGFAEFDEFAGWSWWLYVDGSCVAQEWGRDSEDDALEQVEDAALEYGGALGGPRWKYAQDGNHVLDPRVPDDVSDDGNGGACPLCGSESFDGAICDVCGYQEPPEGFDDIEIEKDDEDEGEDEEDEDASSTLAYIAFVAANERMYDISSSPDRMLAVCAGHDYELVGFDTVATTDVRLQRKLVAKGAVEL